MTPKIEPVQAHLLDATGPARDPQSREGGAEPWSGGWDRAPSPGRGHWRIGYQPPRNCWAASSQARAGCHPPPSLQSFHCSLSDPVPSPHSQGAPRARCALFRVQRKTWIKTAAGRASRGGVQLTPPASYGTDAHIWTADRAWLVLCMAGAIAGMVGGVWGDPIKAKQKNGQSDRRFCW
ncbi:hypothetical protein KIL84_005241 [Mauremys mutica]|uniref:Uncharacterized protein n=1 Tax=Mauremys mutica TaxID=74926 RepID=A0A9D4B5X4_9SAUR|nr:hypothetical protein KIL84_005241 [Mauremys mutica]